MSLIPTNSNIHGCRESYMVSCLWSTQGFVSWRCMPRVQRHISPTGTVLWLCTRQHSPTAGHLRLLGANHRIPTSPRCRFTLIAWFLGRSCVSRVSLNSIHSPPVKAVVHARTVSWNNLKITSFTLSGMFATSCLATCHFSLIQSLPSSAKRLA